MELPTHTLIGKVVQNSFRNWASHDKRYSKYFLKLGDGELKVIDDGLSEMGKHEGYYWDVWYAVNHMRYRRITKNKDMRLVQQMVHEFLSLYARGKLNEFAPATSKRKKRKARE